MNTITKSLISVTMIPALMMIATPSQAKLNPYIETALIDVCKASITNNVFKFRQTAQDYRLKDKTVALKVVCNGDDITQFAEKHGADKTAAYLQKAIGNVGIIDIASVEKYHVNFTE